MKCWGLLEGSSSSEGAWLGIGKNHDAIVDDYWAGQREGFEAWISVLESDWIQTIQKIAKFLYMFLFLKCLQKKKKKIFTTFIIPGKSFLQQKSQVSVNSKLSGCLVLSMHWLKDVFCVIIPTSPWSPHKIHCYLYWLSQCPWVIRSSRGKDGLGRRCPPICYSSLFFHTIVFTIWGSQQEP